MDYETLDDSEQSIPAAGIVEIKGMCGWMTFVGVMSIIGSIISILSLLGSLNQGGSGFSILSNCFTLYLGFLLVSKASSFRAFSEMKDEEVLKKALKLNQRYWMLSTISIIISVLITLGTRF